VDCRRDFRDFLVEMLLVYWPDLLNGLPRLGTKAKRRPLTLGQRLIGGSLCRATSKLLKREAAAAREPLPRWELPAHCH